MLAQSLRLSFLAVFVNLLLFALKLWAAWASGSQALFSDALNSLLDIFSSLIIFQAMRVGHKKPDKNHQFGHHRAEPIAALIIAILAGILSFEVIRSAVFTLISPSAVVITGPVLMVILLTIGLKTLLALSFRRMGRRTNSPSLRAMAIDFRNDILTSSLVILAAVASLYSSYQIDSLVAIVIGLWIGYSGFSIASENLKYLMGESPDESVIHQIREKALEVEGVRHITHTRAQYVGNVIQVDIHVALDNTLTLREAHDIGELVEKSVKRLHIVTTVFVHIDPAY